MLDTVKFRKILGAYLRNFTVWLGVCVTLGLCTVHVVIFDRARDIIVRASHSTVYEPNTNASASNNRILCSLQFFLTWNLKRTSNRYVWEMYVITFHFSEKLRSFCSTVSVLELKHLYLLHLYNSSDIYLVSVFWIYYLMVKLPYLLQQFLVTRSNHSKQPLISQSITAYHGKVMR